MFNSSYKIMFLVIMIMGTILSVSSTSWLSAWMGLEINLLAFIPLMTASNNSMSSEAALKYFLTQALASSILLMAIICSTINHMMIYENMTATTPLMMMVLSSALLLKVGAAPFHFWFPSVIEGLSWMNALMLMTWQKIAPLMLISLISTKLDKFLVYPIIMSAIIGALGGLNQTSLRKIMAFSSINHISWMMVAMKSSESLWWLYFMMYSILTLNMIMMFNALKMIHLSQLFSSMFESSPLKFSLLMNILSLGGLPPFLGFMPKWMVIQSLVMNNQMFMMALLTVVSLITLYFYIRMSFSALMLNYNDMSWMKKQKSNNTMMKITMILSFISNFGLFSVSLMFLIM